MERIVKIMPAYDKRKEKKGIGSCEMFMVLKGELGAVGLNIGTGWYLPETDEWKEECVRRSGNISSWNGSGYAVFYCSPTPLHDFQKDSGRENCDWLGCTCYGDVGYIMGKDVFEILVREGSEKLWEWLQNYYNETFKNDKP